MPCPQLPLRGKIPSHGPPRKPSASRNLYKKPLQPLQQKGSHGNRGNASSSGTLRNPQDNLRRSSGLHARPDPQPQAAHREPGPFPGPDNGAAAWSEPFVRPPRQPGGARKEVDGPIQFSYSGPSNGHSVTRRAAQNADVTPGLQPQSRRRMLLRGTSLHNQSPEHGRLLRVQNPVELRGD